jgi:hypothetical protein
MSVPTLFAAEPLTIAATFDKVWVSEIIIAADDPAIDATARVKLRRFRTVADAVDFSPEPPIWLEVNDLLATSATDPQLASVVSGLMSYVARIGIEQGVVAPPAE